ncbi:MAG: tail fiber domain-containing protein [Bacteroidia bacterium]
MKKLILIAIPFIALNATTQNVGIGTTTPAYKLDVNGNLNINGDSSIYVSGTRVFSVKGRNNLFLGLFSGSINSIGSFNTAIGDSSLYSSTTSNYNTAIGFEALYNDSVAGNNCALGFKSLYLNKTGNWNNAIGNFSLYSNTSGYSNNSLGSLSLRSNTTGYYNTAIGDVAMYSNTTGNGNTAVGEMALYTNTTGYWNVAVGTNSLTFNTTGTWNVAVGGGGLNANTTGNGNTAIGNQALASNATGIDNTSLGLSSGYSITTGSNNTSIGFNAQVPSATSNKQIRLGDANITYAGIQVAWSITSDRRWKSDIQKCNLGIDFISKLSPVSYYRNPARTESGENDESKKREFGFIAQELEQVLNSSGASDNGIISKDDNGMYGVRYNDLIAPMVKAIQELNKQNQDQQKLIEQLVKEVDVLKSKQIGQ